MRVPSPPAQFGLTRMSDGCGGARRQHRKVAAASDARCNRGSRDCGGAWLGVGSHAGRDRGQTAPFRRARATSGMQIHKCAESSKECGLAFLTIYAKCNHIWEAVKVLDTMLKKNIYMFLVMISNISAHSRGKPLFGQDAVVGLGSFNIFDIIPSCLYLFYGYPPGHEDVLPSLMNSGRPDALLSQD